MSDKSIEDLREERRQELKESQQATSKAGNNQAKKRREQQKDQREEILRRHTTDDARQRLNAVEMSKPEFAEQAKQQVAALAQADRIQGQIDGDQMKEILQALTPDDDGYDIRRR